MQEDHDTCWSAPGRARAEVEKLRLNDAQWQRLQRLADAREDTAPAEAMPLSGRLRSNGLVATDGRGFDYLTIYGLLRLSQGR